MVDLAAPARLAFRFASDVGKAVVIRCGPSAWSQLILWNLANNEFTKGQWFHGKVSSASLSPNGEHLALKLQSKGRNYDHYSLVSRPPFFTALAIDLGPGGYTTIGFTKNGKLAWTNHVPIEFRAPNPCPYPIVHRDLKSDELPVGSSMPSIDWAGLGSAYTLETPGGRQLRVLDGCLYESEGGQDALLLDTSDDVFQEMKTPDWALRW